MHRGTEAQPGIVGRDWHRRALDRAINAGLDGGPALTLVHGDAGIGKTTLVDSVVAGHAAAGVTVLRGFAEDKGGAAFAIWDGVRHGLRAVVDTRGGDIDERRWEQLDVLAHAIGAAAPALVVLEDAHWADEQSLWILERMPHLLAGTRVAFVVTSRDDAVGGTRPGHVVPLSGLDPAEVAELLGSLGRAVSEGDVTELTAFTGGNPLFVRELALHDHAGRLPAVVGDALEWTLQGIPGDAMDVLLALSLGGTDLPRRVLEEAGTTAPGDLDACIDSAVRAGILVPDPRGRPRFRHDLLSEAVRHRAGRRRCREMHCALAAGWRVGDGSPRSAAEVAVHSLAAVPDTDVVEVADLASAAAAGLVSEGDPGAAAALLADAARTVEEHAGSDYLLRARLLVELGEALDLAGVADSAVEAYEAAVVPARRGGDPRLVARAEVGVAAHLNPLAPVPATLQRLTEAERDLAAGDDPLRVALLGRLAWACAAGLDVAASVRYGDEAVAVACRIGDPELLATALVDRHFAPGDLHALRARRAGADEIVALGDEHRLPRVSLAGLEWQFEDSLDSGDLAAAASVLGRYESIAALMMSPRARHKACMMRGLLELLRGNRPAALDMFERGHEVGRGAVSDQELDAVYLAGRAATTWIWGVPDPVWERLLADVASDADPSVSPFFAARLAMTHLMVGDLEAARDLVQPLTGRCDEIVRGYQGLSTLLLVADLVCELGLTGAHVGTLIRMLAPLSGLGGWWGLAMNLGVDTTLGRLALLDGDPEGAADRLRAAVAFAAGIPSPPMEARSRAYLADAREAAGDAAAAASERAAAGRIADRIGMDLHRDYVRTEQSGETEGSLRRARLVRIGSGWEVETSGVSVPVPPMAGMDHLARLLARPGNEVAATELAGMEHPQADLGPALDAQAKREYRRRVAELEAEIDEAQRFADPYREDRAREELAAVMDELRRAAGLWGRDRPSGSGAERARVNVTRNLRRAIAAIGAGLPDLGTHLDVSVRTGAYCSYTPDPAAAIEWTVEV